MPRYFVLEKGDYPDWAIIEAPGPEDARASWEDRECYRGRTRIVAEIKIERDPGVDHEVKLPLPRLPRPLPDHFLGA